MSAPVSDLFDRRSAEGDPISRLPMLPAFVLAAVAHHCNATLPADAPPWARALAWPSRVQIASAVWGRSGAERRARTSLRKLLAGLRRCRVLWVFPVAAGAAPAPGLAPFAVARNAYLVPHLLSLAERRAALAHIGESTINGAVDLDAPEPDAPPADGS